MPNVNFKNFQQIGSLVTDIVKQATGRDPVQNMDMDYVSVAQNHNYEDVEVSGHIVSFTAVADGLPLEKCIVQIEPVQKGSGDPSPDNVRPITGWTGANVTMTGKNLLANKKVINGSAIFFGTDVLGSPNFNYTHSITLPAGTYTLRVETADNTVTNLYVAKTGVQMYFARAVSVKSLTFTLSETTDCRIWAYKNGYSSVGEITQFQLEVGSTATAYEPYSGTTIPVSWQTEAGTVYGGTLDAISGVLTVTDAQIASYNGETLPSTWISDRDAYSQGTTPTTGAQVVYKLAEPVTYQLTPTEITTLLGTNNIWADTGDIEVKFKDLKELY